MGITAILAAAMKQISWDQVANIAMKYGPDLIRRFKEHLREHPAAESEGAATVPLDERIRELEGALIKQQEIIDRQNRSLELLEEIGRTLQARLNIFMVVSVLSATMSIVLCILLLRR